ncbi:non-ribosomal peptide synthetase [Micromonospora coerulea]|uniref:non-ribosomal peptide synthetase n=1 Tax=Micromonospora coerulea TaxID=47856 RepID=UPI00190797CD|nr:non-ribosomal peptide synthetase [Micromonospora veneta]
MDLAAVDDAYPLARLQTGMLYHAELTPEDGTYHDIHGCCLTGPFSEDALRATFADLAGTHDALRIGFNTTDFQEPVQVVHRRADIPVTVERVTDSPDDFAAAYARWMAAERRCPFDLGEAPLLRVFVHVLEDRFWVTLSFAHAILDGWSVHRLVQQFIDGYSARLRGEVPASRRPTTRYRDFVALERETLASAEARAFWQQALGRLPEPRPLAPTAAGTEPRTLKLAATIPAAVAQRAAELAGAWDVQLKNLLLAVHLRIVAGLTGGTGATTGVIVNGRPETVDAEDVLGLFLNTLPAAARFAGRSWEEVARDLFAAECDQLEHRRFPIAELQEMNGGAPLFDTLFGFNDFRTHRGLGDGAQVRLVDMAVAESTNFPLYASFSRDHAGAEIHVILYVRDGLLPEVELRDLPDAYVRAVTAACTEPQTPPAAFTVAGPAAQKRLGAANGTDRHWTGGRLLHELIEEQADRDAGAIALICGAERLSYGEIEARANRLAHWLHDQGIGPGSIVGLCVERSAAVVVGLLAVLKAGGAYLPMDPGYPTDRLTYMVGDAGVSLVLTQAAELERLTGCPRVTDLDELLPQLPERDDRLVIPATPGDLAYVIYTSGSTGRPKGVMVTHGNIVNHVRGSVLGVGLTAADRMLAVTTISFDIAGLEIFGPLSAGGTCVLTAQDEAADATALMDLMDRHQITLMQATPSTWRLLLDAGWTGDPRLRVLCGGEAFPVDLAAQLTVRANQVWNMYGPTETAVWSLSTPVDPPAPDAAAVPIGAPMANTRVYVVDELGRQVPPGVTGELLIGGDGVARGYLGQPGLTAEHFIPDAYSGLPGRRLYRTGDLVRHNPDGGSEFLGRIDHQVKLRGFRIELGEIEAALSRHEHVRACVVTLREDTPGDKRLVGYLTGDPERISLGTLRDDLKRQLPDYMVPSALVVLEALPLTANGKLDRGALPAPDTGPDRRESALVEPRTAAEQTLRQIWAEVLGLPVGKIGVHDDFFELGGNSLKAIFIVTRARSEFDAPLPLAAFLETPTIAGITRLLVGEAGGTGATSVVTMSGGEPSLPELVLVHPLGGHVFSYRDLAAALSGRVRLTAMRARGLEEGETPFRSVAEMAAYYVDQLSLARPGGGFYLGGWCMGGGVAHEMAVQMQRSGVELPGLLAISSSARDEGMKEIAHDPLAIAAYVMLGYRPGEQVHAHDSTLPPGWSLDPLRELTEDDQLRALMDTAANSGRLRSDVDTLEDAKRLIAIYRAHQAAVSAHHPDVYAGLLHVIRPTGCHLPDTPEKNLGWNVAASHIDVRAIEGTHYSILARPTVDELADMIVALVK